MNHLIPYLFQTNAVRVCKEDSPFWYTSGKIGPYFINTHFLYGSEEDAVKFLSFIDENLEKHVELPKLLFDQVMAQYENNEIYKVVINEITTYLQENIAIEEVDYISGGERRDWFFSILLANLLHKPHITIFKDLSTVVSDSEFTKTEPLTKLEGKRILHVADLMNFGSSYVRAWIPAIQDLGSKLEWSFTVVDRVKEGGSELLRENGVKTFSTIQIDSPLFQNALEKNIISQEQFEMVERFLQDPEGSMREFLVNHPDFIQNALTSDAKTAKKAQLCVDGNLYHL